MREKIRNQEKGVLAKGVSAGSGVASKKSEHELIQDIGLGSAFDTQSATVKRGVHVC